MNTTYRSMNLVTNPRLYMKNAVKYYSDGRLRLSGECYADDDDDMGTHHFTVINIDGNKVKLCASHFYGGELSVVSWKPVVNGE